MELSIKQWVFGMAILLVLLIIGYVKTSKK